jgi:dihydrofolate synthase/folylpolyglutamate synthase
VDGGHNPAAGKALAQHLAAASPAMPAHAVIGMLSTKDHVGFLRAFPRGTRMTMVPVPGHGEVPPEALAAAAATAGMAADTAPDLATALGAVSGPARVLVGGSLHLAGEFLRLNGPLPN